ncbi:MULTISPECIES: hypothetical protein [Paraburkholderia]|uniref:hypothetical protein n=1 Tax=Paraburkholderia TaxID=1822464 RepID=UPI0035E43D70
MTQADGSSALTVDSVLAVSQLSRNIAYGWGFNGASDFNRAFRRAHDMTPGDFRAAASAINSWR